MSDTTVAKIAQAFIEHLREAGKKDRTLYTYRKDLDIVEGFFGKDRLLTDIHVPQVGKFMKSAALLKTADGRDRAERTVLKTIRVFRMMIVWAKETGRIAELPLPKNTPMGYSKISEGEADCE